MFGKSFAGATVHDAFNLMSVLVLLPLELISGYIFRVSDLFVDVMISQETNKTDIKEPEILSVLTKPLSSAIIQLDSKVLQNIAKNQSNPNDTLIKHLCERIVQYPNGSSSKLKEKCKINSYSNMNLNNKTKFKNLKARFCSNQ